MTVLGYEDYWMLTGTQGQQATWLHRGQTRDKSLDHRTQDSEGLCSPHVLAQGPPRHHGDGPPILVLHRNIHKLIQPLSFCGIRPPVTSRALLLSVDFSSVSLFPPKPTISLHNLQFIFLLLEFLAF